MNFQPEHKNIQTYWQPAIIANDCVRVDREGFTKNAVELG